MCVCGNHDVGNRPTKDTIANYQSTFGDDYFSFWHSGVQFIVLNSQLYEDCSLTKDLALAQDNWLGNITVILQFRKKMFKRVVTFQTNKIDDILIISFRY